MTTLSWNCRGLGNSRTIQVLAELVRHLKPTFVFLIETMLLRDRLDAIKLKLGYEGVFAVSSVGHGGGIVLLWKDKNVASLLSYSDHHIDVVVNIPNMLQWRLTGFYGHAARNNRNLSWNLLRQLSSRSTLPWCCIGDFNDLLYSSEKRGSIAHPQWLFDGFRRAVDDSGLLDIGMEGHPFTWERRRGFPDWIEERLDRALVSSTWLSAFPHAKLRNIEASMSDHSAIMLDFSLPNHVYKTRKFRFENFWLREPQCRTIISDSWSRSSGSPIQIQIHQCGVDLMRWGSGLASHFRKDIAACKR